MKRYLFFLIALFPFVSSCSDDESPKSKGVLVVDGQRYEMSKFLVQPYPGTDNSSVQLFLANDNLMIEEDGSIFDMTGSDINYISFWFDNPTVIREPLTGTFGPDDTDIIVLIGLDSETNDSEIFLDDPETNEVSITKNGSIYSITYTGQVDGVAVSLKYKGKITVLPDVE